MSLKVDLYTRTVLFYTLCYIFKHNAASCNFKLSVLRPMLQVHISFLALCLAEVCHHIYFPKDDWNCSLPCIVFYSCLIKMYRATYYKCRRNLGYLCPIYVAHWLTNYKLLSNISNFDVEWKRNRIRNLVYAC